MKRLREAPCAKRHSDLGARRGPPCATSEGEGSARADSPKRTTDSISRAESPSAAACQSERVQKHACERIGEKDHPPAQFLKEVEAQALSQDGAPDKKLGDHHLHHHEPGKRIHPKHRIDIENADHVGELIDVRDFGKSGETTRQEDRAKRRVVKNNILEIAVGKRQRKNETPSKMRAGTTT